MSVVCVFQNMKQKERRHEEGAEQVNNTYIANYFESVLCVYSKTWNKWEMTCVNYMKLAWDWWLYQEEIGCD